MTGARRPVWAPVCACASMAQTVARLAEQGVTHVINGRPRAQVRWSGDLAAERAAFGPGRVAHAPMQDHGLRQRPAVWAAAACFAARVLDEQPQARVLIHGTAGRRRSAMLAYAVLRLRGHERTRAAALVLSYRTEAQLARVSNDHAPWRGVSAGGMRFAGSPGPMT